MSISKNSRTGRKKELHPHDMGVCKKHVPCNCGATWKTKCKRQLNFDIKHKRRG
jgi:hypothetical protein